MSLKPFSACVVPEQTASVARRAFPLRLGKGNRSVFADGHSVIQPVAPFASPFCIITRSLLRDNFLGGNG
jgi:hypothetical protein